MLRVLPSLAVVALTMLGATGACSSGLTAMPCDQIPDQGCPLESGGTCDDASCAAVYECVNGGWALRLECTGAGGGGQAGAGGSGGAGSGGDGGCQGVEIDTSMEASGCTPDLQTPDCHAVVAGACKPCQTGCLDFFLCSQEGWEAVAFCDGDGNVVLEP